MALAAEDAGSQRATSPEVGRRLEQAGREPGMARAAANRSAGLKRRATYRRRRGVNLGVEAAHTSPPSSNDPDAWLAAYRAAEFRAEASVIVPLESWDRDVVVLAEMLRSAPEALCAQPDDVAKLSGPRSFQWEDQPGPASWLSGVVAAPVGASDAHPNADLRWFLQPCKTTTSCFDAELWVDVVSGPGFGVLAPASLDGEHGLWGYSIEVEPNGSRSRCGLHIWDSGERIAIPLTHTPLDDRDLAGLHSISVRVRGDRLQASVDGRPMLSAPVLRDRSCGNPRVTSPGVQGVGVLTWSSSVLSVERFEVFPRRLS